MREREIHGLGLRCHRVYDGCVGVDFYGRGSRC